MPGGKIPLTGGAYQARSVIASAQRCLNLYIEPQPPQDGEPMPAAHYPTPGLSLLRYMPELPVRAVRQASNGKIYAVAGKGLYRITPPAGIAGWDCAHLGDITPGKTTPASMADNTIDLVVVDGSPNGWSVHLSDDTFASIDDPNFFGADRVDYLDTYFVFNRPGTQQMYWSGALALTFDGLDVASKSAAADLLVTLVVAKKEIILVGERTTEVFYDAAVIDPTTGFLLSQFASVQGVFIDYGTAAKYSVAGNDNSVFFLSRDRTGKGIVLMVAGYTGKRISTFAIEDTIRKYTRIDDAIGFCYQIGGHIFYVLTFPTADHTWVYDLLTGEWHEWAFTDSNGNDHAHRIMCVYPCFGTLLAGDRQYGNLYALDPDVFTDNGSPIKRVRTFPHLLADGKRVFYRQFVADMETGNSGGDVVVLSNTLEPLMRESGTPYIREYGTGGIMREYAQAGATSGLLSLAWSDDRGHTYGNPVQQGIGETGEYLTSVQWQRLGMGRDRVFELSWSLPTRTALQGAWIITAPAQS